MTAGDDILGSGILELTCRYGRMSIFANDLPIALALKTYGEWAQKELNLLLSLINPGQTVLDVGAHVGSHTLAFASAVGPQGKVHAFEPQRPIFQLLQRNIYCNKLSNVELHNAAVADKPGYVIIEPVDYSSQKNMGAVRCLLDFSNNPEVQGERVEAIAIDCLKLESCALIKIDVEGMEAAVLAGAERTLRQHRPLLYLEVTSIAAGWDLAQMLHKLGYWTWFHSTTAYNPDNYRGEKKNLFGEAHETAMLAVPEETVPSLYSKIRQEPTLAEVNNLDQLAQAYFAAPRYEFLKVADPFSRQLARRKIELEREVIQALGGDCSGQIASLHQTITERDSQIASLQKAVAERDEQIACLQKVMAMRDEQVASLQQIIAERDQLAQELSYIHSSRSWRITKPLRMIYRYLCKMVRWIRRLAGLSCRIETPLFILEKASNNQKVHLYVEMAEIQGTQIEVSGWAFSEDYPIDRGVLSLHYGEDVRIIPLTIGIERHDVFYAKGEHRNALRSGFHGKARLGGAVPDKVFITFFVNDSPIRSRIYPRWRRVSTHRVLAQAWRAASLRRIMRGLTYVLRGEWKYIWYRLLMLSNEADTFEPQPVGLRAALNLVDSEPTLPPALEEPVDIIIPVYNGLEYLEPLFESLKRNTNSPHRLIVIDDASPDPQVWPRLQELLQDHPNALLLRNESNLGFVKTVNRGASHTKGDFVLLNTDVEVPPYWLERLIAPIREDRSVASTTPFSNAATICSFPEMNVDNPGFGDLDVDRIDRWFARIRRDLPKINLPSGIGFCMGVNGEVWQRIGPFDEGAFGRGYGEENDWCLRAVAAGYHNVMVPNLFVYHKHGGSFEGGRDGMREKNLRTVLVRYPDYQQRVDAFIKSDPLLPFRQLMTLFIACGEAEKQPILIVDHELGGGANSYSKKMIEDRLAADQPVLLLTAHRGASLFREAVRLRCLYRAYSANFEVEDLEILETLFSTYIRLGEIFYNNAVSFLRPLALVDTLNRIKMATNTQLTIAIHDFYPLCPSYTLLKRDGIYCRLPDLSICRNCLPNNRFAANPEHDQIDAWRQTWGRLLRAANQILCFSEDSRRHVEQVYPDCADRIIVYPHTINVSFARKPKLNFHAPLHIGVIGAISYPKGAGIVADLGRYLLHAHPSVRITVIGTLENNPRLPNLHVTGPYELTELPDLLEQHGINICFLPSIWPETFSYVTAELMALNVPLACFAIGAPAERVVRYPLGRVIREVSAKAAAEELLSFHMMLSSRAAELIGGGDCTSKTKSCGDQMHPLEAAFRQAPTSLPKISDNDLSSICQKLGLPLPISTNNPASRCYGVIFTPRSGSSMLAEICSSTGVLGWPLEFFNPESLPDLFKIVPASSVEVYADALRRYFKSPADVFGLKVTPFQIAPLLEDGRWWKLYPDMYYVILTREDVVAQAVSLHLMVTTGVAHTSIGFTEKQQRDYEVAQYDAAGIYKWLRHILQAEWLINAYFARYRPLRLTYEHLVGSPEEVIRRIAGHVGVEWNGRIELVNLQHQKIGGSRNEEWAKRFREENASLVEFLLRRRGTAPIAQIEADAKKCLASGTSIYLVI